eukprot:TRINITY_DN36578_c0_g1_i1.p1 TRINITY_DN36578_c0_g1~~TRINITY_DN36578_c0_g1_i1.p1  ORF type:complete len:301 (+),score=93.74 TRINITY_DN36578_c0_g1_i1:371-1273(+)
MVVVLPRHCFHSNVGCHEISAYTFSEDEAVELVRWKPFDMLVVNSDVTASEAQQAINLITTASSNPRLLPVYVPGNDRNVVNAVLEAKLGEEDEQAGDAPPRRAPLFHGDTLLPDEQEEADRAYARAEEAAAAMEADRKEKEAAEAAEAAARAKEEEEFRKKQDEAREQQSKRQQERKARAEASKNHHLLQEQRVQADADKARFFDKIEQAFVRVDKNQDGHLTRAEVIRALRRDLELPALLHLPTKITTQQGAESQRQFEEAFQRMDIDQNREIDTDEFKLFCLEIRSKQIAACKEHVH